LIDFKKVIASFLAKSSSMTVLSKRGRGFFQKRLPQPLDWQPYWVKKYPPALVRIFVVDIDEEVLKLIKKISEEEKLGIETLKYDVRKPLHPHLLNIFDIVFADPPYTENGVSLFLSRGISALELLSTSRLYFCYGQSNRARERSLAIQKIVAGMGLLIEERLNKFNRYFGAASIGSASALYINSIIKKTKLVIQGKFTGKIYTWERR